MGYRYILERYKGARTRHTCPNCGRPGEFTRYFDVETGNHLAGHVGRCNREVNCGYHYTPKQYYANNKIPRRENDSRRQPAAKPQKLLPKPMSFIPFEAFRMSLSRYDDNNFVRYLHNLFHPGIASELVRRFYIGTSEYWEGATIFWQIDARGRIRSGKIMQYHPATGRRVKEIRPDGSKRSKITWAHSVLQKQGLAQDFNLRQCLFGEHQLSGQPRSKPVAVVEAEKTAIIAAACLPDLIWLACGGLQNLNSRICNALRGRRVILFPDSNGFEKWEAKAKALESEFDCRLTVSDLLERKAGETDKAQGFDLADYLISQMFTTSNGVEMGGQRTALDDEKMLPQVKGSGGEGENQKAGFAT